MQPLAIAVVSAWALALLTHWWPRLGVRWRRWASMAASAAGLAFLVAALQAEGLRESATTATVVVGSARVTALASASASFYYYVLTATCLLLGFAGLVAGDTLARWLAPRALLTALAVAGLLTALRFLLEKSAAPALIVQAVGITWIAPVVGAYFAFSLRDDAGWRGLLRALVLYAFAARGLVAAVGAVATRLQLGSHYDVSPLTAVSFAFGGPTFFFEPGSWRQVLWLSLAPQLLVWPVYTVGAGLLGAAALRLLWRNERPTRALPAAGPS